MKIGPEELRRLYRSYVSEQAPSDRRACPSGYELLRFFEPRTSRRRKRVILNHITSCPSCADRFDDLIALNRRQAPLRELSENIKSHRKIRPGALSPPIWRWATTLLGITLIFSSILVLWHNPGTDVDIYRSPSENAPKPVRPTGRTSVESPVIFEWTEVPRVEQYRVDIFDDTLLRIWQSPPLDTCSLALPPEAQSLLRPARSYYWMVTALTQSGRVTESSMQQFLLDEAARR